MKISNILGNYINSIDNKQDSILNYKNMVLYSRESEYQSRYTKKY